MADAPLTPVLQHLRKLAGAPTAEGATDGQLRERFATRHDEGAFATLMDRHGPLVFGVCQRVLRHGHDAEDAFQATFLLLAQKAGSIRKHEAVGSWLYKVAYRMAARARAQQAQRRRHERQAHEKRETPGSLDVAWQELRAVLDEEFQRLPEKYRAALVLCYLEGRTHEEAARQLGWPLGTVKSALTRGRDRLRTRLTRRGLMLSAGSLTTALVAHTAAAAAPAALAHATLKAALLFAAGQAARAGVVSANVAALVLETARALFATKLQGVAAVL